MNPKKHQIATCYNEKIKKLNIRIEKKTKHQMSYFEATMGIIATIIEIVDHHVHIQFANSRAKNSVHHKIITLTCVNVNISNVIQKKYAMYCTWSTQLVNKRYHSCWSLSISEFCYRESKTHSSETFVISIQP